MYAPFSPIEFGEYPTVFVPERGWSHWRPKPSHALPILGIGGGPIYTSKPVHTMFRLALEKARSRQADPSLPPVIVSIPTAKDKLQTFHEHIGTIKTFFGIDGLKVDILHSFREQDINLEAVTKLLETADLLVVPGGSTELLIAEWKRMGLLPLILAVIKRGVVVVGHSAGLIAWFEESHTDSEDYVTEPGLPWKYKMIPATGLIPAAVSPHAADNARYYTHNEEAYSAKFTRRQDFVRQLHAAKVRRNGVAVDGDTGVLFEGHWGTVHGTGRVTLHLWGKNGQLRSRVYKPGQRFRLSTLTKKVK
jgi:peptidase E